MRPVERAARRALALLACTQFLLILDTAIINVAAPSIGDELTISPSSLSWVGPTRTWAVLRFSCWLSLWWRRGCGCRWCRCRCYAGQPWFGLRSVMVTGYVVSSLASAGSRCCLRTALS